MKIRLNKLLKMLAGTLTLTVLFSCADSFDIKETEASKEKTYSGSENPVVKFTADCSARTILPAEAQPSQLTNYTLSYSIEDGPTVTPEGFSNISFETLTNATLEFSRSDVNKDVQFMISAKKGTLNYFAATTIVLNGGQNEVELLMYRENLGNNDAKGNISLSVNLSGKPNAQTLTKVTGCLCSRYFDQLTGNDAFGEKTFNVSNSSFSWTQENVPYGSYVLMLTFYAGNVPVLKMNPVIQVADGLTTYVTEQTPEFSSIKGFNPLYTITFNPNAGNDNTVTYTRSTKVSVLVKELTVSSPERDGYLFTGWYTDAACTHPFYFPLNHDITLYAGWKNLNESTEGLYFATMEKLSQIASGITVTQNGYGTQEKPAVIKMLGPVLDTDTDTIEKILKAKNSIWFELDLSEADDLESWIACNVTENICGLILPETVSYIDSSCLDYYPSLRKFEVSEESEYFKTVDNILYDKDENYLYFYPAGLTQEEFEIPEGVQRLCANSIHGGNLKKLVIPASVTDVEWCSLYYSYGLNEIEVSDQNRYYKSIDGIGYTKDDDTIKIFPTGLESFNVPHGVRCIDAYALYTYKKNLKTLTADGNSVFFYGSGYCSTPAEILLGACAVPQSKILTYDQNYIYILDKNDAVEVQAYEDAVEVTDVSDPGFTRINLNSTSSKNKFYKFT
ncbi:MAG: InlB B-repeat-containing protein, partial [Treponema sp.]|nr:InlB B-repeat-containing protein [Treponema sp.]